MSVNQSGYCLADPFFYILVFSLATRRLLKSAVTCFAFRSTTEHQRPPRDPCVVNKWTCCWPALWINGFRSEAFKGVQPQFLSLWPSHRYVDDAPVRIANLFLGSVGSFFFFFLRRERCYDSRKLILSGCSCLLSLSILPFIAQVPSFFYASFLLFIALSYLSP